MQETRDNGAHHVSWGLTTKRETQTDAEDS